MKPRVVVMIPTYNERANVVSLVEEIFALGVPGLEILVVDDESPDGTSDLVAGLAKSRPSLRLLRRPPPRGRGLAGRDGYLKALESGAERVIEMDGDGSHRPRHIPELLAAMDGADIVIGSRLAPGGLDLERSLARRALTALSGAWARALLGVTVADVNSGFRCFSRAALEAVSPGTLDSEGPSIVHETLHRAARAGLRVREIPIDFADRRAGESKLGARQLISGWLAIVRLRFR